MIEMEKDSLFYEKLSFHTHPSLYEENYDGLLEAKGYSAVDKTNVMTVKLMENVKLPTKQNSHRNVADKERGELVVTVEDKITEAWQYYYFTFNKVSPSAVSTAKKIQAKIINPVLCATVYVDKKAIACGLGVMEQGYVGLLDIVVKEEYRGRGFGKVLCQALLDKAKEEGATTGYLQVVDSNTVAKKLYEGLGFKDVYNYWYRVK